MPVPQGGPWCQCGTAASVHVRPAWSPRRWYTAGWGCRAQGPTEPPELPCGAGKSMGQSLVLEGGWHRSSPGAGPGHLLLWPCASRGHVCWAAALTSPCLFRHRPEKRLCSRWNRALRFAGPTQRPFGPRAWEGVTGTGPRLHSCGARRGLRRSPAGLEAVTALEQAGGGC